MVSHYLFHRRHGRSLTCTLTVLVLCGLFTACSSYGDQDSGGRLLPEQAAYDVTFYDLDVEVFPQKRAIAGTLTAHAVVEDTLDWFVLHLDTPLEVKRAAQVLPGGGRRTLSVERKPDYQIWIKLPRTKLPGDSLRIEVEYGGQPRVATNPPWSGGFSWNETPEGHPWIATSCQTEGADLWWPVKDHPSDEPDSMAIDVTVPEPLVVASNGRLRAVDDRPGARRAYRWFVSTPINTYAAALNIAPYETLKTTYESTAGETIPVSFWALPSDTAGARRHLPGFLEHVRFLEKTLGPYPFRADKYGIAQTPFLGMEHQTIIAYGNTFGNTSSFGYDQGFDALHFHELAHEWFGNLATNRDWKDFWLHEGFASYLEALYAEELNGQSGYRAVMGHMRGRIQNRQPIARHEPTTAQEIYSIDIYMKGAWVLHTLRYLIGDEAFFEALQRMAYPEPELETLTGGQQCRFVVTDDFVRLAEEASGRELDWFFDTYVYQANLPRIVKERAGDRLTLRWDVPEEGAFPMPVPVEVDGKLRRVAMDEGTASLKVGAGTPVQVDPRYQVLHQRE